jgi:hypothetical protein
MIESINGVANQFSFDNDSLFVSNVPEGPALGRKGEPN